MYRDTQAWEVDRERFMKALPTLERFRGQLSTDGSTLLAAIKTMQSVETMIANLYVYAGLRSYEDTRVSENARALLKKRKAFTPGIKRPCLSLPPSYSASLNARSANL